MEKKEALDKLFIELETIKDVNFNDNFTFDDLKFVKDFFNKENSVENIFDRLKLFLVLDSLESQELKIKWIDFLVYNKIVEIINGSEVFGMTIISLLKLKEAPNFNVLPKVITSSGIKYSKVLDILFGESVGAIKPVMLVEYIRQKDLNIEQTMIQLIKVKVIDWFRIYEPKTSKWYIDFLDTDPKDFDYKIEVGKILELIK